MAEFFEFDPISGIRTDTDYNELTGEMTVIRTADVEKELNIARAVSNEVGPDKHGKAEGWHHYAVVPPAIYLQMRAKGINIFDESRESTQRMFEEINANYSALKVTTGKEGKSSPTRYFMPGKYDQS
jgi:hypothetical protein